MERIRTPVTLRDLERTRSRDVEAIVDARATLTVIPEGIANELGLKVIGESEVRTMAGRLSLRKAEARVEIGGKEAVQSVLISYILDKVVIGAVTLASLTFTVDPIRGELKEGELLLY